MLIDNNFVNEKTYKFNIGYNVYFNMKYVRIWRCPYHLNSLIQSSFNCIHLNVEGTLLQLFHFQNIHISFFLNFKFEKKNSYVQSGILAKILLNFFLTVD